ncbi:glycosyltransferase [Pleurocapsa sp. FMAR1]|uniref:glycosyltransferase n=1 Tax=Pleurocapsa sp. FMAR1 TaxID=3040204 RepID=UPI0029C8582A|nr:glycosyltransferase [Pleurocapsa sp. FMAR1]
MNPSQTIALISVYSDPATEVGSQNVYVRSLAESLSRLGWQVDIFTRKTNAVQANIVQHNPNCRTIRLNAGVMQYISQQQLIGYLPEFLKQLRQFQIINRIQYGLIHTNYWLSAWVGMELKKTQPLKHVHTYHSLGAVKYAHTNNLTNIAKTRLAIEKACLETADLSIATCPQQKEYLQELVSTKGNIEIVPCATDTRIFGSVAHETARQKLGIKPDIFNILYVGRFDHRHGLETLLKAVSKPYLHSAGNIRLTLVSNSHRYSHNRLERKRIEKRVRDLGIENITTFDERLSREKLAVCYAAADVCVVPNHYSPLGMVAIEAMASGTSVIAANADSLKYIVQHEQTGLLFPARNSFVLTKAIFRLMNEPEWRLKLSVSARERVYELFDWDGVANQLGKFYLELIVSQDIKMPNKLLKYSVQPVGV